MDALSAFWHGLPTSPFSGLTTSICTTVGLIAATYSISTLRASRTVNQKRDGSTLPTLPYAIPLLGHLPDFLWDMEKLFAQAYERYGPNVPVQFKLLHRRMSLIKGPAAVSALFKSSRDLSSEQWLVQALVNAFGVEVADAPFYLADDTGINLQPDSRSTGVSPEHRVFHLVYKSVHDGLSGARLEEMQSQLIQNLSSQMADADIRDDWTEIPDFYGSFVKTICFRAAMVSLCGSHVLELIPSFDHDFWEFDRHLPNIFKEFPRWLVPESFRARDRMKENIKNWHAYAHENYEVSQGSEDKRDWEEYFGSRLMRTRHEFFAKMPLSKETLAADDLGLIWAATANSVPAIGWMILEVLQRPSLLARVRNEMAPFISQKSEQIVVDIDGLCSQTLLQSIYAEVLRVHNGTVIARFPRSPDLKINGWHYPPNQPILVSTYNTARDPTYWNQGTVADPHPVDNFWPERFIIDPADPSSGPVTGIYAKDGSKSEPKFSLNGTDGSWVPYGGGSRMCPGRHFAKKELIVTMAMFLTVFDIELKTEPGKFIENDMGYFMFGVMHPKGRIPARIRRRRT